MSRVAFGVKAHSGWAALVALGECGPRLEVTDRRRLELVDPDAAHWAKQPYHAAAALDAREAEELVARSIAAAERCAVLLGSGMPPLTLREILAVHARMHQAEGELFRRALVRATERVGLELIGVREKELEASANETLSLPAPVWRDRLAEAGRGQGPPWARDQKDAATCAWIALRRARCR